MFTTKKKRSTFGKFLDSELIKQSKLAKKANVSESAVSKLASDKNKLPNYHTAHRIVKALNKMGYAVDFEDFWKS